LPERKIAYEEALSNLPATEFMTQILIQGLVQETAITDGTFRTFA